MATITVKIIVTDIDEVIQTFNQIKVYRSTTGVSGTYTELTAPGTRPALVANQTLYTFVDSAGDNDYFYRVSYFNSSTLVESSQSAAQQGEGDPALDVLSVDELKSNYLFGVELTDKNGCEFPESIFEHHLKGAVGWVERRLDIRLAPYIIEEERHDFYRQDYYKYMRLQLDEFPIISVESVRLVLPTEQEVINFDPSWWQVQNYSGQFEIIPGNGQLSVIVLGQTGAWLPLIYGWSDYIPHVFRVAYTAGFPKGKVPFELLELVGKVAAIPILHIAGDIVAGGAGVSSQSTTVDGISTSIGTIRNQHAGAYAARISQYKKEVSEAVTFLRRYYKGARFVVV